MGLCASASAAGLDGDAILAGLDAEAAAAETAFLATLGAEGRVRTAAALAEAREQAKEVEEPRAPAAGPGRRWEATRATSS